MTHLLLHKTPNLVSSEPGAAHTFVSQYRNVVSHPSRTPKEAINRIRKCRKGFLDAVNVVLQIQEILEAKEFHVRVQQ
jgi:hypothetical protein